MKKQPFQPCFSCQYKSACNVAQSRLEGLDMRSPVISDIGCFGFEIYKKQVEDKQLGFDF